MTDANVTLVNHPLVLHKLTLMRDKSTSPAVFRQLLREISLLIGYEALRDLSQTTVNIETPITNMVAPVLKGKSLIIVSIMRAGNGLLDGILDLVPTARVGHIGLYRDSETMTAVEYYLKMPDNLGERRVIVVDPMLATGNSASAAVARLKELGATDLKFACLLAAPEGIKAFKVVHPDVQIYTAAIDDNLDEHGYIVPGLGDAGDRMFGTK